MSISDTLISFETAKLAKEKGFKVNNKNLISIQWCQDNDAKTNISYEPKSFLNGNPYDLDFDKTLFKEIFKDENLYMVRIFLPTQSLLQKWLREKHKVDIMIEHYKDEIKHYFKVYIQKEYEYSNALKSKLNPEHSPTCFSNYEEALEKGLYQALKLIL